MIKRLAFFLSLIFLAACSSPPPTQDPNGPILGGIDNLPKDLATVYLSPTPNIAEIQATQASQVTALPIAPPTNTATPTPYLGLFIGATGSPIPDTGLRTATRGPLVVTLTLGPGTKAAVFVPPVSGNPGNPPPVSGGGTSNCAVQPAPEFANASKNAAVQARLGCPTAAPFSTSLVIESFQTGFMIWRDTKEIYVISTAALQKGAATDTFWRFPDNWNDSIPPSDPNLVPPTGLIQPIRGFGYVWRSNANVRNGLGWATANEQPYQATWQVFEHGWMMTGTGVVFALVPIDGPPPTTGIHFGPLAQ